MDYSTLQSVVVLATAFLGVIVTLWPPSNPQYKLGVVFVFLVFGVVALWLQRQKETVDKTESTKAQNLLLNWQRGDPVKPPRVGFTQALMPNGTLQMRFTVHNPSDFPAYEISVRVWDVDNVPESPVTLEDIVRSDITNANIASLAPQTVQIIGGTAIPPDASSKRYACQFTTRVGGFSQSIKAQKVDNKWLFATQVRTFDASEKVIYRETDPGFPLNAAGEVDW